MDMSKNLFFDIVCRSCDPVISQGSLELKTRAQNPEICLRKQVYCCHKAVKQALLLMATSSLLVVLWVGLGFVTAPSGISFIFFYIFWFPSEEGNFGCH